MISDASAEYEQLIGQFLAGDLSAPDFQDQFTRRFAQENMSLDAVSFLLLNALLRDVEAFAAGAPLLEGALASGDREAALRGAALRTAAQLSKLRESAGRQAP